MLDTLPDALLGADQNGELVFVNRQAVSLFGYSREELLGEKVEKLVPPQFRGRHPSHRERYDKSPETRPMAAGLELSGVRRDGTEFPAEISLSAIDTPDGRMVVAAVRDVTERKQIERERDALRKRQSERLESLGQLAGGVAHDFNNLLAVISSYARFAERMLDDRPEIQSDIGHIQAAAERAAALTRQLLIFARRETVQAEVLDVNRLVAETSRLLNRALGERVTLDTDLDPEIWPIEADPGQIEQVVANLSVNARDAMPEGGQLRIETSNVDVKPGHPADHGEVKADRYVRIRVSDTGTGISPDALDRIFEPFFSTKAKGAGTGLGLATVHGIVLGASGFINVRTVEGRGTTFDVHIPATLGADGNAPIGSVARAARGRGELALVVEDDDAVREVTRRTLAEAGYEVVAASDAEAALARFADPHARVDILVTDVVMPGMLGTQLAERVAELRPETPVIFLSGYTFDAMSSHAPPQGALVIEKPFSEERLLAAVRQALDTRVAGGAR